MCHETQNHMLSEPKSLLLKDASYNTSLKVSLKTERTQRVEGKPHLAHQLVTKHIGISPKKEALPKRRALHEDSRTRRLTRVDLMPTLSAAWNARVKFLL